MRLSGWVCVRAQARGGRRAHPAAAAGSATRIPALEHDAGGQRVLCGANLGDAQWQREEGQRDAPSSSRSSIVVRVVSLGTQLAALVSGRLSLG